MNFSIISVSLIEKLTSLNELKEVSFYLSNMNDELITAYIKRKNTIINNSIGNSKIVEPFTVNRGVGSTCGTGVHCMSSHCVCTRTTYSNVYGWSYDCNHKTCQNY